MGNQQKTILNLIKSISGQANVLTLPVLYLDLLGNDHKTALFLSQCVYWGDRTNDPEGWFHKSRVEWFDELRLSREEQERILATLKDKGFIETKLKKASSRGGRLAPKLHYRVIYDVLENAVIEFFDLRETHKTDLRESHKSIDLRETHKSINIDRLPENIDINAQGAKEADSDPEPEKVKKERDKNLDNPAIIKYREIVCYHVPKAWREIVVKTVGDNYDLWEQVVRDWIGSGYNPGNVKGMLGVFNNGGVFNKPKQAPTNKPVAKVTDEEAEFAAQNNGKVLV